MSDIDLYEENCVLQARESFYAYRRYMHPRLKINWFVEELTLTLQNFYADFVSGKSPVLAISAPPQHGKSSAVVDFIAWIIGKDPSKKLIYTSFSNRLGVRANAALQRTFNTKKYQKIFPCFNPVNENYLLTGSKNSELVEFPDTEGYFRNTTVRGSITGESLECGFIDDPIKGREAANSKTIRDNVWDWLTDDFFTRFSEDAALLFIMTRWHVDDPLSRLCEVWPDKVKFVNYPAEAIVDEKYRKIGEPLFPELKSKTFLESRRKLMGSISYGALYQGDPKVPGGNLIKTSWFQYYKILPLLTERRIFGDTAQKTAEINDYTVLECWGIGVDKRLYLIDLLRGKWTAPELKKRTILFWRKHLAVDEVDYGSLRALHIEDTSSGTGLIQELVSDERIPVKAIQRQKDKYTRFLDSEGYIESGYVVLPENAPFVNDFLTECEEFTADDSHAHDDQIDPMLDAIVEMKANVKAISIWESLAR